MHQLLTIVTLALWACTEVKGHTRKPAVPLCLPKEDGEKTLQLQNEGLDVLKKIGNDPVVVVCIAGPARTGKSYFLSKLSDNADFEVGHGMKGKTTGIWISANDGKIYKDGVKARLVLLDAEGIGSITGDKESIDRWDSSIVSLCTLMSSVLIYNSNKIPSHYDMQKLHFFSMFGSAMGSDIKFRSKETLIWLIRDNTITLKEYPDWTSFFKGEVFQDTDVTSPNGIITGIKKMFPKFQAIALPPPSVNSTICENLDDDEFEDELSRFRSEVDNAAKEITTMAAVKHVAGGHMSGSKCLDLLKAWVRKINEKGSNYSWKSFFELQERYSCEKLIEECKSKFNRDINRMNFEPGKDCLSSMRAIEKKALSCFDAQAITMQVVRDEFSEKLTSFMVDEKSDVLKKCAKTQFQTLLGSYRANMDSIDLGGRGTKLSDLVGQIDGVVKRTIDQFESRNIAETDPVAEYWEKLNAEIEKTKTAVVHKWMEHHFKIFSDIHERELRGFNLDNSRDALERHIARIEDETRNHFEMDGISESWPVLEAKLDALMLKMSQRKENLFKKWEKRHKLDDMYAAIGTMTLAGTAAGGVGFLAGGPPGAVIAATASAVTGSVWAIYEYFTSD